jgi:hypothetical protein
MLYKSKNFALRKAVLFYALCLFLMFMSGAITSSPLARQPLVGSGLLKKHCLFVSVEGGLLPIDDL